MLIPMKKEARKDFRCDAWARTDQNMTDDESGGGVKNNTQQAR